MEAAAAQQQWQQQNTALPGARQNKGPGALVLFSSKHAHASCSNPTQEVWACLSSEAQPVPTPLVLANPCSNNKKRGHVLS